MPDPSHPPSAPTAARFLEQVLLASFVIHLVALVTMATICLPGVPGGTGADGPARLAYVADHAVLWRLGWVPWHLSAAVDLLTAVALLSTRWIPRLPALLTLLVTLAAVGVEQSGEIPWTVQGPTRAAEGATPAILRSTWISRTIAISVPSSGAPPFTWQWRWVGRGASPPPERGRAA